MTAFLPPNLLALFAAREPVPYFPPVEKMSHEKKRLTYNGLAEYVSQFEEVRDQPKVVHTETREEKKERRRKEKLERAAYKLEQDLALWDPHAVRGTVDPYKTLFIARMSYDTSESKLRREFEEFGPIRKVYLIKDSQLNKSRGYGFIEFEHERDMHDAYKHADGRKIDGRRVVVDYERGRTVKGWRPRRLGGGLGGDKRRTRTTEEPDVSAPPPMSSSKNDRRSREREPERDRRDRDRRDKGDKDHKDRSDRDRDRRRSRSRSRSRSKSRDRKRVKEDKEKDKEKRSKDKRERSTERDRRATGRSDKSNSKTNDDTNSELTSGGRRRRKSSGSNQDPADYYNKSKPGAVAAFDSDGEDSMNGKDSRNFDGSSQGF